MLQLDDIPNEPFTDKDKAIEWLSSIADELTWIPIANIVRNTLRQRVRQRILKNAVSEYMKNDV